MPNNRQSKIEELQLVSGELYADMFKKSIDVITKETNIENKELAKTIVDSIFKIITATNEKIDDYLVKNFRD